MDEKNALKDNIQWLMLNGHMDMVERSLSEVEGILSPADCLALQAEWQIRQQLNQQARENLSCGLTKFPFHKDLLELSLFLANEVEHNERESQRAAALLSMLTGVSIVGGSDQPRHAVQHSRVLHGTMEIAGQMNTLVAALLKKGISSRAVNYYKNYLSYNSEEDLSFVDCRTQEEANLKAKAFAADMLSNYDIFHFHFGTTLTFDHSDLSLLEPLSKKRVMHYWGSDVRRLSVARKHNPYVCVKNTDELKMVNDIKKTAIHIQDCIVGDHELYLYVKDYFPRVHILRQAIDLSSYYPKPTLPNPRPLFVHAPTSPEVKGTEYILRAIDTLRQEYDFDFQLIQGMSHNQAKATYQQADLIIDQILIGSYGLLTVEAMAMGKPVVCWISEYMKDKYPGELPLLIANPDTITDVLRNVLNNQDMLPDLGLRGRVYAEQYHDANVVAEKLVSIYKGL